MIDPEIEAGRRIKGRYSRARYPEDRAANTSQIWRWCDPPSSHPCNGTRTGIVIDETDQSATLNGRHYDSVVKAVWELEAMG